MTLILQDISPSDWHPLSLGFRDLSFEQTRAYAEPAAQRVGGQARFVAVRRGRETLAIAALRVRNLPGLRRGIIWLPAGPLVLRQNEPDPDPETLAAVLSALRHQLVDVEGNVLRLRFSALSLLSQEATANIASAAGFAPTTRAAPYKTFLLDTSVDEDEAMRRLNGKWRGHLRNAFKAGLAVEMTSDATLTERFERVMASVQEAKGFAPAITPDFHRKCQGEGYALETFIVSREGRDLSAGMLVVNGANANYLFGATNAEGREHRSGYQLTWSIMGRCRALGLKWMDLGGVDSTATPELTVYKERTGALYVEGAGPYEANPGGLFTRALYLAEDLRNLRKRKG